MHITDFDAAALSRKIHAKEVSCGEVMQAFLGRIEKLNPSFNAIVNLAPHMPPSANRMLLPGAWRENDHVRRDGSVRRRHVRPDDDSSSRAGR